MALHPPGFCSGPSSSTPSTPWFSWYFVCSPSNLTLSCQYCHHHPNSLGGSCSWAYCAQTGSSGSTKGFHVVALPPFMLVAMFTHILPKNYQCHPILVLLINSLETISDKIFIFLPQLLQMWFIALIIRVMVATIRIVFKFDHTTTAFSSQK